MPTSEIQYPYLTGYVAFYAKDYKRAVVELQQADQEDPFILLLTAEAYEHLGDLSRARELLPQGALVELPRHHQCVCTPGRGAKAAAIEGGALAPPRRGFSPTARGPASSCHGTRIDNDTIVSPQWSRNVASLPSTVGK